MKCNHLKIRTKKGIKYGYCSLLKKEVPIFNCKCENISYIYKERKKTKSKSYKITKLERNRTSLLTDDLSHCIICGKTKQHLHEVFEGTHRVNSMKYACVIPLCVECHNKIHSDRKLALYYKRLCQTRFEQTYTIDFISVFKKNYK